MIQYRFLEDLVGTPHRPEHMLPGMKRSLSTAALTLEAESRFVSEVATVGARSPDLEERGSYFARSDTFAEALRALPRFAHSIGKVGGQSLVSLRHDVREDSLSPYWDSKVFIVSVAGSTVLPRSKSHRDGLRVAQEQSLEPSLVLLQPPSGAYRILWVFGAREGQCPPTAFDVFQERFWGWYSYIRSISCFQGYQADLPRSLHGLVDGLNLGSPLTRIDPTSLRWYSMCDLQRMRKSLRS